MLPEDDYLRLKPVGNEHRTIQKIAIMALMGCLILLTALVAQAGAGQPQPLTMQTPAAAGSVSEPR